MIHVRVTDVFCWQRTAADLGHCRWILAHTSVLTHLTSCMISIIWHLPCSFQTISGYPDLVQIHFSIILYGYDGKLCIFSGLSAYGFRHYSLGGHFIGSEADKNKGLTWKEAGCYTTNEWVTTGERNVFVSADRLGSIFRDAAFLLPDFR